MGTWNKIGPRQDNYATSWTSSPINSMMFPSSIPDGRFAHTTVLTGSKPAIYVIGGLGGSYMMQELSELWKFDLQSFEWTYMGKDELLGRYDSAAVLYGDGSFALVYGGHVQGNILGDALLIFL